MNKSKAPLIFVFRSAFILFFVFIINDVIAQKRAMADSIFEYICQKKIAHPEIVIKQAILETGWFTAPFLMSRNNIFGFRKTTYLRFNNWKECVDYYKRWQDKRYVNPKEDYYKFLVRIKYAVAGYTNHIKKIKYNNTCK